MVQLSHLSATAFAGEQRHQQGRGSVPGGSLLLPAGAGSAWPSQQPVHGGAGDSNGAARQVAAAVQRAGVP